LGSVLPAAVSHVGPAGETRQKSIARAAREYVEQHHAEPLSLTDVSDHLNFSPGYLGALFKAEYGIPLKAYLRRVRIARAKELMRDPRLNLTEVALRVGFEDISYFSQSFLEETGVRPSEYRGGGRHWPK
jgi:two-component system response regulator YesN